jgi:predicted membrane protein
MMTNTMEPLINNPEDVFNSVAVFGEVKKTIISKDFKGGRITNILGKTQLDFSFADIKGMAVVDITQALGEVVIIVPADWRVETDQLLILATFEDKRPIKSEHINAGKVLVTTGTSIFGNVKVVRGLF